MSDPESRGGCSTSPGPARDLGWRTVEVESLFEGAYRFDRLPKFMRPLAWLPQPDPRRPGRRAWSAVALLTA